MTQEEGSSVVEDMIKEFDSRSRGATEFRLVLKALYIPDLMFYSETVSREWLHRKYNKRPFWTNEVEGLYSIEGKFGQVWKVV